MEPKNSLIINKELYDDIKKFCDLNKIDDVSKFVLKCLKRGVDVEIYGLLGKVEDTQEKIIEKEIIVEKRIEVPVEVIKEVEKIIEVPIEIVKEIPVEKIVEKIVNISGTSEPQLVYVQDEVQINLLKNLLKDLEMEKSELLSQLEKNNSDTNQNKSKMLEATLQSLKKELLLKDKTIVELNNKIKQLEELLNLSKGAVFLKGTNLNENI
jgi:hypothetical protein